MPECGCCEGDRCEGATAAPDPLAASLSAKTQVLQPPPPRNAGTAARSSVARGLVAAAAIAQRLERGNVILLDIGFGTGHAALEAIEALPAAADTRLRIVGLGYDASVLGTLQDHAQGQRGYLTLLARHRRVHSRWGKTRLYWGDPRRQVIRMRGHADVILLEPSSVSGYVELFTVDFLRRVAACLAGHGILATPVADAAVRSALCRLGLHVGRGHGLIPGGGTLAAHDPALVRTPLSLDERALLDRTLDAVPYRDTSLCWTREQIRQHRRDAVARLHRRGWRHRLARGLPD